MIDELPSSLEHGDESPRWLRGLVRIDNGGLEEELQGEI